MEKMGMKHDRQEECFIMTGPNEQQYKIIFA